MAERLRNTESSGKSWLAPAVLFIGLLTTVVIWHVLRVREWVQINWTTKLASDAIRNDLVESIQYQLYGLDRLALLREKSDPPQKLWIDNAKLYIQHRPGCIAVEWLAPDGASRAFVAEGRLTRSALAFEGSPHSLIERAALARKATISTPLSAADGRKQYAIAYPVYSQGRLEGFVVSFFDFRRSLDYILEDVKPLGYAIELSQGNQHESLLVGNSRRYRQEWGTTTDIPVPGGTWQARVWPSSDVLGRIRSHIPAATLAVGILLSCLLALLVHIGVSANRKSAQIRRMNEHLRLEVQSRIDAQNELSRTHGELEIRVQQRTAELAAVNGTLEREIVEHRNAEQSLQELAGRVICLKDDERRKLARELHDGATQNLVALAMNMGRLQKNQTFDDHHAEIVDESARLIKDCIQELRTTAHLLHPPLIDELGLPIPLRSFVNGFATRSGIQVTLALDPSLPRMDHEIELAIFRIVQEALTNIHRHSHGDTASVSLSLEASQVRLEISDNGSGFTPDVLSNLKRGTAGVGIAGMRERVRLLGGSFELDSAEVGTTVRVLLPTKEATLPDQLGLNAPREVSASIGAVWPKSERIAVYLDGNSQMLGLAPDKSSPDNFDSDTSL